MSSPDNISFSSFIKIDRRKSEALYLQIVYQFIQAIQRHYLEEGEKIPGSRQLSKDLKIHRKTVFAALEELREQGWIYTKPAIGTFVRNPERKKAKLSTFDNYTFGSKADFEFHRSFLLDSSSAQPNIHTYFTDGTPDYRLIKTYELSQFYSSALRRKRVIDKIATTSLEGNPFFKEQLRNYLHITKRVRFSTNHLLTAGNKSIILYILSQLLIRPGDQILVGTYSYYFANMIFQQAGAKITTIPMDTDGLQVAYIRQHFKPGDIRMVYIQPEHQYPTTTCLSAKRREELLQLAQEYNFIIIEDGSDDELTYEKTSTLSLMKTSRHNQLIYIGNFGHFLPPGFQTGYMLAPEDLIHEAQKYLPIFEKNDLVKEQALAEMIHQGDIHRYRRKALTTYHSRRDYFHQLLTTHFSEIFDYSLPQGGLAFWLRLSSTYSIAEIVHKAEQKGLFIPQTCCFQNRELAAFRLGFGHLNDQEMQKIIKTLRQAFPG